MAKVRRLLLGILLGAAAGAALTAAVISVLHGRRLHPWTNDGGLGREDGCIH